MKKLLIASLALAALSMIPITYLFAARDRGNRTGSDRTSGASVRTARVFRTKNIDRTGVTSKNSARTGSARRSTTNSPSRLSTRAGSTRISTTSSPTQLSTRSGARMASGSRAGRGGRRGGRGAFWGHRNDFRHFRGNFWELGIGYPWWWNTYPHICLDEFGFEYPTSFCYQQPNLYFWWYR